MPFDVSVEAGQHATACDRFVAVSHKVLETGKLLGYNGFQERLCEPFNDQD